MTAVPRWCFEDAIDAEVIDVETGAPVAPTSQERVDVSVALPDLFDDAEPEPEPYLEWPAREAAPAPEPEPQWRPIGEILVELGAIEPTLRDEALHALPQGTHLGAFLVHHSVIDERTLARALGEQFELDVVDLRREAPAPDAIAKLPENVARALNVMPVRIGDDGLELAFADPRPDARAHALEQLAGEVEGPVRLLLAPAGDIRRAIESSYRATARIDRVLKQYESQVQERKQVEATPAAVVDENAPVVQVVSMILEQAVRDRASDVHVEPLDDRVRVRARVDGALHEMLSLPAGMAQPLVSRIKVMAELNIVERRRPQDGQFGTTVGDRELDVRVSTTSTVFGEKCVLRLLDKSRAVYELVDLGLPRLAEAKYRQMINTPYGMVICAGPTGSGKTTTLYASLTEINREEINLMTIEDPVEYVFPEINQIQINDQAGITFASGLRSILRQDPDALLVGEIRDVETARIAVQAALTGHFVMSSIHATDSAAALHRFLDMGIEPYLISSSLVGVVAQRLVRRICPTCRGPYTPSPDELAFYEQMGGPANPQFYAGEGCNFCSDTGYFERIGVYEIMPISDALKQVIVDGGSYDDIRHTAVAEGMRTLSDEAVQLVGDGVTTIAEVLRTVYVL